MAKNLGCLTELDMEKFFKGAEIGATFGFSPVLPFVRVEELAHAEGWAVTELPKNFGRVTEDLRSRLFILELEKSGIVFEVTARTEDAAKKVVREQINFWGVQVEDSMRKFLGDIVAMEAKVFPGPGDAQAMLTKPCEEAPDAKFKVVKIKAPKKEESDAKKDAG